MKNPDWARIRPDFATRLPRAAAAARVRDIVALIGRQRAKAILGVPGLTLRNWEIGHRTPPATVARWVHVCWFLLVYFPGFPWWDVITEWRFIPEADTPQPVDNCGLAAGELNVTKHKPTDNLPKTLS